MIDSEKQQMTLTIAGKRIVTKIARKDEAFLRMVERNFNSFWEQWRLMHPAKNTEELLAMAAFQYAMHYYTIEENSKKREAELLEFIKKYEQKLNDILLDV